MRNVLGRVAAVTIESVWKLSSTVQYQENLNLQNDHNTRSRSMSSIMDLGSPNILGDDR